MLLLLLLLVLFQAHGQLVLKGQAALTAPAAVQQPGGAAAAAAAGGDVDDDDIFGDAGTDYAPALPQKKEGAGRWVRLAADCRGWGGVQYLAEWFEGGP